ncbi:MAG: SAM-dependent methyltransferase, partial [Muribaculaceae bacterium]|nr:SAM-dependent methyltransferase [Muribaculaceae bacterium]
LGGEKEDCIKELIAIKSTKTTIESVERLISQTTFVKIERRLYLINPHYEIKFGLKPRLLSKGLSKLPYLRDFLSTSCFYILQRQK